MPPECHQLLRTPDALDEYSIHIRELQGDASTTTTARNLKDGVRMMIVYSHGEYEGILSL